MTAEQIVGGYQQLIQRPHTAGIKIIGATLTPYKTSLYYTEEGDAKRLTVNEWVRNSRAFDGYVDFDKVLQDPANPLQMLPDYDSGDNLHPSDAGYQAMADAVNLSLLNPGGSGLDGQISASRYDGHQGEIFWTKLGFPNFLVFRDGALVTPDGNNGNSFYQNTLIAGQSYDYQLTGVDAGGVETSLGFVSMPGLAGISSQ